MRLCLTGDLFINRPLPPGGYTGFNELASLLREHDACIGNLETVIRTDEGFPTLFPGGGYATTSPDSLTDIKRFGFNLCNAANNHSCDFGQLGLLSTISHCRSIGLPVSGIGENMHEASRPRYLETPDGRVAMLSVTSSFHDSDKAGLPALGATGRPGVSSLRHEAVYDVPAKEYEHLQVIADKSAFGEYHALSKKRGYLTPSAFLEFGSLKFRKGSDYSVETKPNRDDFDRTLGYIEEARASADCVIVSVHSHQFKTDEQTPPEFITIFAKACIEAGADIIYGHGVHATRGIEMHRGHPIFYSFGNFIFQNETVDVLPAEICERYGYEASMQGKPHLAMRARSGGGTRGFSAEPSAWSSVVASIDFNTEQYVVESIRLLPIDLHGELPAWRRGWPTLANDPEPIIAQMRERSASFGTSIDYDGFVELTPAD